MHALSRAVIKFWSSHSKSKITHNISHKIYRVMLAFKRAQPWQVLRVTALNEWMISSGDMSKTRVRLLLLDHRFQMPRNRWKRKARKKPVFLTCLLKWNNKKLCSDMFSLVFVGFCMTAWIINELRNSYINIPWDWFLVLQ